MSPGEYERMSISAILQELDAAIARLQQAKQLLSGMSRSIPSSGVRGTKDGARAGRRKRLLSAEARQGLQRRKGSVGQPGRKWPSNEERYMVACCDDYNPIRVSKLSRAGFSPTPELSDFPINPQRRPNHQFSLR